MFVRSEEQMEDRHEYNMLFKVWEILTGFSRDCYLASDASAIDKSHVANRIDFRTTLPSRCRGMCVDVYCGSDYNIGRPLRFAFDIFLPEEFKIFLQYRVS